MTSPTIEKYTLDLLIRQERHYRDTQQWSLLRSLWHPDPTQTHVSISFIKGTVDDWIAGGKSVGSTSAAIGPFHTMEPKEILISGDGKRALATTLISIRIRFVYESVTFDLVSWAHQIQRFVRLERTDEWKLTRFEAVYIRDELGLAYPQVEATEAFMAGVGRGIDAGGARECVKVLSWWGALGGLVIRGDVAGYDEEGSWRPVVEEGRRWLEGGREVV